MHIQRLSEDGDIPRRLIQAASEVFARHGYAGSRIREIVREAEVHFAAVNYYFGGKEGLYAATLKQLAAQRTVEPVRPAGRGENAEDALYQQVLAILQRYVDGENNSTLGRILAHESMNPTENFEQLITDLVRPELERLVAIVRRLAGDGADEVSVNRAAMSVMGQCLFYLFARGALDRIYPHSAESRRDCEALARHITGFSLMGIAVHSSRAARAA
ncbi:MAG TPA: CerR family C-terminal domain-containing protein [Usitatibacter sp.]|nr:CerR family C-terminal domain-containing protein [Usitatibacter sp.]